MGSGVASVVRLTFLVALSLLLGAVDAQLLPLGTVFGPVPVAAVTDGDTLVIESNVGPRIVRLIGIDAPEPGQSSTLGAAYAAQATAFLSALAPVGAPVWLELDLGATDTYGRLLAYLYVEDEHGEWVVAERRMRQVNLALAEAGLASVMTVPPNTAYEHLYVGAVDRARRDGVGMWGAPAGQRPITTTSVPVTIHCALYNPDTPNDTDGEWVSLLIQEAFDTTGLYLYDEGSKSVFPLPNGVQEPGEVRVHNPGQGVWNNSGDVIYLMHRVEVVDSWDYSGRLAPQGRVVCRGGPDQ